jgi:tight adherence protein B
MGAWVGLLAGVGLLLVWRSGSRAPSKGSRGLGLLRRQQESLRRAGVIGVSAVQLIAAQAAAAVIIGLAVLVITSTLAIAACFAAFGPLLA